MFINYHEGDTKTWWYCKSIKNWSWNYKHVILSVYKYMHSQRSLFDSTKMAASALPIILWSASRFLVTAVKSVVAWNPQIPSGSWNTAAGYQPTSERHTIAPLHGLLSLSYMWQQNICKTVRTTFYSQNSKIISKSPTFCIITLLSSSSISTGRRRTSW